MTAKPSRHNSPAQSKIHNSFKTKELCITKLNTALRRNFWPLLLLIALLALALRIAVGAQLANTSTVLHPLPVTDMATYRDLALSIRKGVWPEVFDYQPFYYTVFLPFAYLFSPSGGPWPVIILQAIVGTATVLLTGLAAARIFGRKAGLLAAILLALSRMHIFYTSYLLLEVWFSFWSALVFYCTVRCLTTPSKPEAPANPRATVETYFWPALLGLALGGALLTRGSALLWLPGLLALLAWHSRKKLRRCVLQLLLLLLCFTLPILPYSIHNSRATGHFQGASVAGGKVLLLGNTPEAPPGGLEYPRTYYHWLRDADRGRMSVPEHILNWARQQPLAFLELKFRALMLFWDAHEIPNNISLAVQGKESSLLQAPFLLPWSLLGTFGLAGLLLTFRRLRASRLALVWLMLAFWGATSAFYLLARFRIGFLPLLCCAGGAALAFAAKTIARPFAETAGLPSLPSAQSSAAKPKTHQAVLLAFVAILSCYVVNFACPIYRDFAEPAVQRYLNPNGLNLEFRREFVLYDHGPLTTASTLFSVPPQGLTLTKRFRLPEAFRKKLADDGVDRIVRQHLQLRLQTRQRGLPNVTLTCNGTRLPVQPAMHVSQGVAWLDFDFEAPLPAEDAQAIFAFELFPSPAVTQFSVGIDETRNYGRTSLHIPGLEEEVLHGEAVVEWIIPRRPSPPPNYDL